MLSDLAVSLGMLIIVALMLGLMELPGAKSKDSLSQRQREKLKKLRELEAQARARM